MADKPKKPVRPTIESGRVFGGRTPINKVMPKGDGKVVAPTGVEKGKTPIVVPPPQPSSPKNN